MFCFCFVSCWSGSSVKRDRFLNYVLKDEIAEQCLKSKGSEFQVYGPKQEKAERKPCMRLAPVFERRRKTTRKTEEKRQMWGGVGVEEGMRE